jgi:hypothetical protein
VTQAFCSSCTRIRLSTEGQLYTCLFAQSGHDLRALLREGAGDEALRREIAAVWRGRDDRYSEIRTAATALPAAQDRNVLHRRLILRLPVSLRTMTSILQALSCADNYDPNSLHVDRARELILDLLPAVSGHERVFVRQALDRVLAEDVISPIDVPSHDNSAMDGWAVRFDDLAAGGETRLKNIGTAFAGRAFAGKVGAGETVRIMTGAVLPQGVDTVVIQEVAKVEGDAVIIPPGQQPRAEHPPRRRGPAGRQARHPRRPQAAPGRDRHRRLARDRRSFGAPPRARGDLFHRRRTVFDRHAAGGGRGV